MSTSASASAAASTAALPVGLVAGCYERAVYGFELVPGASPTSPAALRASFLLPAHNGCVKAVAAAGRWVASGSTDEVISIMDTRQMAQVLSLHHHEGDVSTLAFHADEFMFSASVDGRICVYRTGARTILSFFHYIASIHT